LGHPVGPEWDFIHRAGDSLRGDHYATYPTEGYRGEKKLRVHRRSGNRAWARRGSRENGSNKRQNVSEGGSPKQKKDKKKY